MRIISSHQERWLVACWSIFYRLPWTLCTIHLLDTKRKGNDFYSGEMLPKTIWQEAGGLAPLQVQDGDVWWLTPDCFERNGMFTLVMYLARAHCPGLVTRRYEMNTGWEILGLTIKCPSQIHVLNARSSAGNTILRIHGTIRKWGLAAGSCWLGEGPWLYVILAHFLSLSLCFLVHCVVKSFCNLPSTMSGAVLSRLPYYDGLKPKSQSKSFFI